MRRALLLEDDPTCARVAQAELLRAGYSPIVHRTSERGARGACLIPFALCLVDASIRLTESGGVGSGLAFVQWLLGLRPGARVVLWSAADVSAEAHKLGAAFVMKGDREALRAAIG